jgi:hypothetical protein
LNIFAVSYGTGARSDSENEARADMNYLLSILLAPLLTSPALHAKEKTLSSATLRDKGYQRLDRSISEATTRRTCAVL